MGRESRDLDLVGRVMLKLMVQNVRICTGFMQLVTVPSDGLRSTVLSPGFLTGRWLWLCC